MLAENQYKLFLELQAGNESVINVLINQNLFLIKHIINQKFSNSVFDFDELFQVGKMGLYKAIQNFKLEKNTQFSTFAYPIIRNEIINFLVSNGKYASHEISIEDTEIYLQEESFIEENENNYLKKETIHEIMAIIQLLPEDRRYMLLMNFGFNSENRSYTVRELAQIFNCHHSYVGKCIQESIEIIRLQMQLQETFGNLKSMSKKKIA